MVQKATLANSAKWPQGSWTQSRVAYNTAFVMHMVHIMCTGSSRDVKFCLRTRRPHSWSCTLLGLMYSWCHRLTPCIRPSQEKHANLQMHWMTMCTHRFSLYSNDSGSDSDWNRSRQAPDNCLIHTTGEAMWINPPMHTWSTPHGVHRNRTAKTVTYAHPTLAGVTSIDSTLLW